MKRVEKGSTAEGNVLRGCFAGGKEDGKSIRYALKRVRTNDNESEPLDFLREAYFAEKLLALSEHASNLAAVEGLSHIGRYVESFKVDLQDRLSLIL